MPRQIPLFGDDSDAALPFRPVAPVNSVGELDLWLDTKPTNMLFGYAMFGGATFERIACLRAIIRREVQHQTRYHTKGR